MSSEMKWALMTTVFSLFVIIVYSFTAVMY